MNLLDQLFLKQFKTFAVHVLSDLNILGGSGVNTMGLDRTNSGAPNPNGTNGGPQAVGQKH